MSRFVAATAVALSCALANPSHAFTAFSAIDRVATPSITGAANCLSSLAAWTAAASPLGIIHTADMETLTPGASGSHLIVDTDLTLDFFVGALPGTMHIRSTAPSSPIYGFNTTTSGSTHIELDSPVGSVLQPMVRLTFAQPIQAFSFMLTGEGRVSNFLGDFISTRVRVGGPLDPDFSLPDQGDPYFPSGAQPNARFGGYVNPGASVTVIEIDLKYLTIGNESTGTFSIDDIRWVPAPVPGPGAMALVAVGVPMCLRRKR